MSETQAQKRNRKDFEAANEIMDAASALMKAIDKAKERELYVNVTKTGYYRGIRVTVRRDLKYKSLMICDAEIGA